MKLYRTVSIHEYHDYKAFQEFRTAKNTLEAKQFFQSLRAVEAFVKDARLQKFDPPYAYVFVVDVDEKCLNRISFDEQELDRHLAITIQEVDLDSSTYVLNL